MNGGIDITYVLNSCFDTCVVYVMSVGCPSSKVFDEHRTVWSRQISSSTLRQWSPSGTIVIQLLILCKRNEDCPVLEMALVLMLVTPAPVRSCPQIFMPVLCYFPCIRLFILHLASDHSDFLLCEYIRIVTEVRRSLTSLKIRRVNENLDLNIDLPLWFFPPDMHHQSVLIYCFVELLFMTVMQFIS